MKDKCCRQRLKEEKMVVGVVRRGVQDVRGDQGSISPSLYGQLLHQWIYTALFDIKCRAKVIHVEHNL